MNPAPRPHVTAKEPVKASGSAGGSVEKIKLIPEVDISPSSIDHAVYQIKSAHGVEGSVRAVEDFLFSILTFLAWRFESRRNLRIISINIWAPSQGQLGSINYQGLVHAYCFSIDHPRHAVLTCSCT